MWYSYVPGSYEAHMDYDPWAGVRIPEFPAPEYVSALWKWPFAFQVDVRPVQDLAVLAVEHGWRVTLRRSVGRVPHAITGKPSGRKELWGLRFGEHPATQRRAYAVYSRNLPSGVWSWTSVAVWGSKLSPYLGCGVTELKAYLMMPGMSDDAMLDWVRDLKTISANGEVLKKRRDAARREIIRLHDAQAPWEDLLACADGVYVPEEIEKIIKNRKVSSREGLS